MPGNVAAYSYDGIQVLTEAIQKAGTDREEILKALYGSLFKGITGSFRFDKNGNRTGNIPVVWIKNGIPGKINKTVIKEKK